MGDGNDTLTGAEEPDSFWAGCLATAPYRAARPAYLMGRRARRRQPAGATTPATWSAAVGTDAAQVDPWSLDAVSDEPRASTPPRGPGEQERGGASRPRTRSSATTTAATPRSSSSSARPTGRAHGPSDTPHQEELPPARRPEAPLVLASRPARRRRGPDQEPHGRRPKGVKPPSKHHKLAAIGSGSCSEALTLKFKK